MNSKEAINIKECDCHQFSALDSGEWICPWTGCIVNGLHYRLDISWEDEKRSSLLDEIEKIDKYYDDLEKLNVRKSRKPNTVYDWKRSSWRAYIDAPDDSNLYNLETREGKRFRNRFRITFDVYKRILLPFALSQFPNKPDALGNAGIPTEYKLLGVLRILGRSLHFDDIAEIIGCGDGGEVVRVFFHKFLKTFVHAFYPLYVYPPENMEEIKASMDLYTAAGLPGCLCSTDGVHIRWDACPDGLNVLATGKEKYPTLSYSVTVGHNKYIYSSTASFLGAQNDLTTSRYDGFLNDIKNGKYDFVTYTLFDKDGIPYVVFGVWVLCDGGYHKWKFMQCPLSMTETELEGQWSRKMESMRKDVEGTFGILKNRFRILKYGLRYPSQEACDNVVFACMILHNMLLQIDGLDKWEGVNSEWLEEYHHHDEIDALEEGLSERQRHILLGIGTEDGISFGFAPHRSDISAEVESEHAELRERLIITYDVIKRKIQSGTDLWPTRLPSS